MGRERRTRSRIDRRDHAGLGMPETVEDIVSDVLDTPSCAQGRRGVLTLEIMDSIVEKWAAHDLQP
jgi:hypothetical protein